MIFGRGGGPSVGMRPPREPSAGALVLDVGGLATPDLATVGALARLQLLAKRRGERVRLRQAAPELVELIAFAGLADVLPCEPATRPGAEAGRRGGRAGPCPGRT